MFTKICGTKFLRKEKCCSIYKTLGVLNKCKSSRYYSLCCPPPKPPCGGCPAAPGGGRRVEPPVNCRRSDIPYNPCCPQYHHGKGTWKKYKYFALFVCFPLIIIQALRVSGHERHPKGECRDYEYMRIRNKKYPWGDGNATFFHNDEVNHLPGECVPPPLDCD